MLSAIFEIVVLLAVSCAIGIFFTYRYWKLKNAYLTDSVSELMAIKEKYVAQNKAHEHEMELLKSQLAEQEEKASKAEKPKAKASSDDSKKLKQQIKELKEQLELHEQSLDEKEREIEELSRQLAEKKISYYKQIDGKRYKAVTLMKADEAIAGQGDGRISKADAEKIFATISDGKAYTQVEKDTMYYLRHNYRWTDEADELFRRKVRSWAAKGHELN